MQRIAEHSDCPVKTYSMTLVEVELAIKNTISDIHSYHPELEKRIEELGEVMGHRTESENITIESYLDRIFEKKLIEFGEEQVKQRVQEFDNELKEYFIKEEKRLLSVPRRNIFRIRKEEFTDIIIEGCKALKRGDVIGSSLFSSPMLYDAYLFASSQQTPLEFLAYVHYTHALKGKTVDAVKAYTKQKYSSGMYKIEMYENRGMFAELYQYIRAGMYSDALKFIESHKNFFSVISNNFHSSIISWMCSMGFIHEERKYTMEWEDVPSTKGDPFKLLFYRLFTGNTECVQSVITTIEDFLWYHILVMKTITACGIKKRANTSLEIFKMLEGSVTAPRLLQTALMLKQWKEAMRLLQDDTFKAGEMLFISHAISQKIREESPFVYPIKRELADTMPAECTELFIKAVQGVTSLFLRAQDKLSVVNLAAPFISAEWLEDLVAEVFIASEDYAVLGDVDASGRRQTPTIQEHIDVSWQGVVQRVAEYYTHSGDLLKALKISYIAGSAKTLEILTEILVHKIETKEYTQDDLEPIIKHFNNELINFLWDILLIGASRENAINLIRRAGLVPENNASDVLRKVREIQNLTPLIKSVIPAALVITAQRLGEFPTPENQDPAKALLLLAGALEMDKEIMHDIVTSIAQLL
ncbi:hypothetical protein NEAUS06_1026 [Nematocida ausubeli]|nr:hypothetical protein NEAUS06_0855 [Nematocida ausubeli]KAI5134277.1 hypothetical protein NEAUS06_1026 [Nematocida ausubeli]